LTRLTPLLVALLPVSLRGQLDLLTLREAYSIAERIPAIVEASKRGECPQFSAIYRQTDEIWIQARRYCGSEGGTLINNYSVNRRTGIAIQGEDGDEVLDAGGQAFAQHLVVLARSRRLTLNESHCLALEAAKGLPGWSSKDALVTVGPLLTGSVPPPEPEKASFTALNNSSVRPLQIAAFLTVDLSTAEIRDDETGMNVTSPGLSALTVKITTLREQVLLTNEEAMSIALNTPSVTARIPKGCVLTGGGVYKSNEAIAGVSCKDGSNNWSIAIKLDTGEIVDAETRRVIDSTRAKQAAREFLEKRERKLVETRNELDALCGSR
jgi:hypothetical protein